MEAELNGGKVFKVEQLAKAALSSQWCEDMSLAPKDKEILGKVIIEYTHSNECHNILLTWKPYIPHHEYTGGGQQEGWYDGIMALRNPIAFMEIPE